MSRAKTQDKSTDVSLFPFLAVLLCTMGSLLVVLVAVTRLSRAQAAERVAAEQAAEVVPENTSAEAEEKLQKVKQYADRLKEVRAAAKEKLQDDQQRLAHLEDHMRRLQDELLSLQIAAAELAALEEEHDDDRQQAEREIARLQSLIEETRERIEELKADAKSKLRSYAVVPYKGASGTERRPIYIECRNDEVILQPEGVQLTPDDFLPPLGPGNPLASALRAAREYMVREQSGADAGADSRPYPLILVRPDGIAVYYGVRSAIESWDSDFGYELIDGDWDLKFPPPNPRLAELEYRAVEQARARQRLLAAAAPRAYGLARAARRESFGVDESGYGGGESGDGYGDGFDAAPRGRPSSGEGNGHGNSAADHALATGSATEQAGLGDQSQAGKDGTGAGGTITRGGATPADGTSKAGDTAGAQTLAGGTEDAFADAGDTTSAGPGGSSTQPTGGQSDNSAGAPGGAKDAPMGEAGGAAGLASSAAAAGGGSVTPNSSSSGSAEPAPGVASLDYSFSQQSGERADRRGKNWALQGVKRDAVPIRRSIHVVVHQDRLAVLPERTKPGEVVGGGREVRLQGDSKAPFEEFLSILQDHVHAWGMAGDGLYWRPVLVFDVGPDGQQRAGQLTRLLRNSGMEVRRDSATAQLDEGSDSRATR